MIEHLRSSPKYQNVVSMSFSMMTIFLSYNSVQNYLTSILPGELGNESLTVIYFASLFSIPFVQYSVKKIGEKHSMLIASSSFCFYLLSLIGNSVDIGIGQRALVLFSSTFLGFGQMLIWVAQGSFLAKSGTEETRALNTGTFQAIYQLSNVFGNLLAFFVYKYAPEYLFPVLFVVAIVGTLSFLNISPVPIDVGRSEVPSFAETFEEIPHLIKQKEFLPVLLFLFFTGLEISFYAGTFPTLLPKASIGLVLFFLGLAEFLAGFSMDYVTGLFGNQNMLLIGSINYLLSILLCFSIYHQTAFFVTPTFFEAPWSAYVSALLMGFSDCIFVCQAQIYLANNFSSYTVSAFTIFQMLQNLGMALGFYLPLYFPLFGDNATSSYLYFQLLFLFLSIAPLLTLRNTR